MTRRFLGLSEPTWRILATGAVTAIWMLVAWTATAYANDCAAYVNDPKNFTGNLQGLIEDCMRTGYVQAVTTLLVGGIGGGGIAIVVTKGLKDAGKNWKDPNAPGPEDAGKKDGETPEPPPPVTGRDSTPEPCRGRWDDYRKATEEEFQKGKDLATVTNRYHHVVNNHMSNLAKVTIQLGMDAADLGSAGVGGIKGGMSVAKAVAHIPEGLAAVKNLLAKAIVRSGNLETLIHTLAEGIAELLSKGRRLASAADDAGRLSAKTEAKIADLVKEAAHLEGQLDNYKDLVKFARSADATLLERNAVAKTVSAADDALRQANRDHQHILNRKKALDDWAAAERMAIANEDARAFAAKHDELGGNRNKLQQLQAENAEAAKVAHADWQKKMNQLSAAKKELDEARAAAAHLQKARQEKILAEQEFRSAADYQSNAEARLKDAESELLEFDKVAKEVESAQDAVRKLQAEEEALTRKIQTIEEGKAAKQRYLEAEKARDHAAEVVEDVEQEIKSLEAEGHFQSLQREFDEHKRALHWRQEEWKEAYTDMVKKQAEYDKIMDMVGEGDDAVMRGRAPTKFETNQLNLAQGYEEATRKAVASTRRDMDYAAMQLAEARKDPRWADVQMRMGIARHNLELASADLTGAETKLQRFSHPGIDLEAGPRLEAERTQVRTDMKAREYEAASKQIETPRSELEKKVAAAQTDSGQATQLYKEAETRLTTADADLKTADLSGTGEPLDALRTVEARQARYLELVKEQDALRARYEALKSGGDSPEALGLKQRIDQLDGELAKWRDPDFETEAAKRNPTKYNEWKVEQGGLDRIGESQANITTLEAKLSELQTSLATVERKLSEQQQQTGGKSTAELEAERDKLKEQLKARQSEVETAKSEKQTQDQARAQAEKEKDQADSDRQKKEAEKQKAEEEKRQNDEELARLKRLQDNPVPPPEDVSWLGNKLGFILKPVLGKDWTPYQGSEAEGIANKSHQLRQKFDETMDAITPDWLTAPFRWAGSKAGELFHKAFGGQSPEEVAAALKHGQQRVKEMEQKLKQTQDEFDVLRAKAHQAKAALEACSAANQPATSAAENN